MQFEFNKSMKVFSQLYVGLRAKDGTNGSPLGFATPHEDNAAGRKRQATVDSWCKKYNSRQKLVTKIVENIPREGFKITDDIKRIYWGGGNVVFRVLDPDGFELEIQGANLMAIINAVGIEAGGIIPGKCLWGREGAHNILIHESSDEYKTAILAAETIKKPKEVGAKERVVGGKYQLLDGSSAIYLGKMWVTTADNPDRDGVPFNIRFRGETLGVTRNQHPLRPHYQDQKQLEGVLLKDEIRFYKKAPLIALLKKGGTLTADEVDDIALTTANKSFASSAYSGKIVHASTAQSKDLQYFTRPWTYEEFADQLKHFKELFKHDSIYALGRFLNTYPNQTILKHNEQYLGNHMKLNVLEQGVLGDRNRNVKEEVLCIGPIDLGELNYVTISSDRHYSSNHYYYGRSAPVATNAPVDVLELTRFKTFEEAGVWCRKQFDDGNLLKIVVNAND